MKKKVILSSIITFVLFLFSTASAFALDININGANVAFDSVSGSPLIDGNGHTLVPLRATMEAAGATVGWDATTKTATVKKGDATVLVPVGQAYIIVDGETVHNDAVAAIIGNKTYLPIRAVLEALNFNVEWDNSSRTVFASDHVVITDWVPYSSGDLTTLLRAIANGNVVYYEGQYWASPEYVESLMNEDVIYNEDVSPNSATPHHDSKLTPDSEYTIIE